MKSKSIFFLLLITICNLSCNAQNKQEMQEKINPLLCNPESGICEIPTDSTQTAENNPIKSEQKPIKIIYYTDPICSSCWGIEPQLRKLKLVYGNIIEVDYRMGGLLPDWSYNSGGISKPSDVAHHWDEVSVYYDMPIDGDVWLEDPLSSSFPPSIAFKAAQMQDKQKAVLFLREMREMVFLQKKNITKWEHIARAATNVELDPAQLKIDFEGKAKELFEDDLKLGKQLGVRGFPTLFFTDTMGNTQMVYGSKPYSVFEGALLKLHPDASKISYDKAWKALFQQYNSLTAKEFSELSGIARLEAEKRLNELTTNGEVDKYTTKNGSIWTLRKSVVR